MVHDPHWLSMSTQHTDVAWEVVPAGQRGGARLEVDRRTGEGAHMASPSRTPIGPLGEQTSLPGSRCATPRRADGPTPFDGGAYVRPRRVPGRRSGSCAPGRVRRRGRGAAGAHLASSLTRTSAHSLSGTVAAAAVWSISSTRCSSPIISSTEPTEVGEMGTVDLELTLDSRMSPPCVITSTRLPECAAACRSASMPARRRAHRTPSPGRCPFSILGHPASISSRVSPVQAPMSRSRSSSSIDHRHARRLAIKRPVSCARSSLLVTTTSTAGTVVVAAFAWRRPNAESGGWRDPASALRRSRSTVRAVRAASSSPMSRRRGPSRHLTMLAAVAVLRLFASAREARHGVAPPFPARTCARCSRRRASAMASSSLRSCRGRRCG